LSNDNLTVTKQGPDGIGVIYGDTQLESGVEYEWEITLDESKYLSGFGICNKKFLKVYFILLKLFTFISQPTFNFINLGD
jgi:hypothetical protein